MKHILISLSVVAVSLSSFSACVSVVEKDDVILDNPEPRPVTKTVRLLENGDIHRHWYTWLRSQRARNVDPDHVFTAEGSTLKVSGTDMGCVTTRDAYRDYRLSLEFRYVDNDRQLNKTAARDGGILFHSTGADGVYGNGIWMSSFEYNIIQGAAGDLIVVGSRKLYPGRYRCRGRVDAATRGKASQHWDPNGVEISLVNSGRIRRPDVDLEWKNVKEQPLSPNENPVGEWNRAVVVCRGDTAVFYFNGMKVGEYRDLNPTGGRIQLQSEGFGIEYRNIVLEPLDQALDDALDNLLPRPRRVTRNEGTVANPSVVRVEKAKPSFTAAPAEVADQAYRLTVTPEGAVVEAAGAAGERYARATLAQLVKLGGGRAPCCVIEDWPAFRLRGFMNDCGRNFQSKASILATLELMAKYKYNFYHWHLTDDPAWRLESKRHPELQSSAAFTRQPGLFYTQGDFREIFAAAERKGILIVPELDMPGHCAAFRRAFGLARMDDPRVGGILADLIDELCTLVPADRMPYIHIGSDEVRAGVESVPPEWYELWAETVRRNGRTPILWVPGHSAPAGARVVDMVWGQRGEPSNAGHEFFDTTKSYYLNHLDTFEILSAATYQQPCRWQDKKDKCLGPVLSYWHDVAAADTEQLMRDANVFPALVAFADTYWCGRDRDNPAYWGRLPLVDDPLFARALDLERRLMAQKRKVLGTTPYPFQYVPQTQLRWRITDFDGTVLATNATQATIMPQHALFSTPDDYKPSPISRGVRAETWIHSDERREVGAWIGFTAFSRARDRAIPPAGAWNRFMATVTINGEAVEPPEWPSSGEKLDREVPFTNEEYCMRPPTRIVLEKGWNHVELSIPRPPKTTLDSRWTATFIPVAGTSDYPEEVKGLTYSSLPPAKGK